MLCENNVEGDASKVEYTVRKGFI